MNEMFLLKLGEIVLKGQNKRQFENKLRQNVRRRMKPYGEFDVYLMQSTVYVEPKSEDCDVDGAVGGLPRHLRRGEPVPLPSLREGPGQHL